MSHSSHLQVWISDMELVLSPVAQINPQMICIRWCLYRQDAGLDYRVRAGEGCQETPESAMTMVRGPSAPSLRNGPSDLWSW